MSKTLDDFLLDLVDVQFVDNTHAEGVEAREECAAIIREVYAYREAQVARLTAACKHVLEEGFRESDKMTWAADLVNELKVAIEGTEGDGLLEETRAALKPFANLAKVLKEGDMLVHRGVYVSYDQAQAAQAVLTKAPARVVGNKKIEVTRETQRVLEELLQRWGDEDLATVVARAADWALAMEEKRQERKKG
jgi:hypothetical protein